MQYGVDKSCLHVGFFAHLNWFALLCTYAVARVSRQGLKILSSEFEKVFQITLDLECMLISVLIELYMKDTWNDIMIVSDLLPCKNLHQQL